MAYVKMSMAEARVKAQVDPDHVAGTTESEIRHHMREDGFDPDMPFTGLREIVGIEAVRIRMGLSRDSFAGALGIPTTVLQDWEDGVQLDPVAKALITLVGDDPERAVRVLKAKRSGRRKRLTPIVAAGSSG